MRFTNANKSITFCVSLLIPERTEPRLGDREGLRFNCRNKKLKNKTLQKQINIDVFNFEETSMFYVTLCTGTSDTQLFNSTNSL